MALTYYQPVLRCLQRVPSGVTSKHTIGIRLAGVDAPECAHFAQPAQPYGEEAKYVVSSTCGYHTVQMVLTLVMVQVISTQPACKEGGSCRAVSSRPIQSRSMHTISCNNNNNDHHHTTLTVAIRRWVWFGSKDSGDGTMCHRFCCGMAMPPCILDRMPHTATCYRRFRSSRQRHEPSVLECGSRARPST
jgi:hypothetical protein